jgi:hypothetical protein
MGRYNTTAAVLASIVFVGLGVSACGSDSDSSSAVTTATEDAPAARAGDGAVTAETPGTTGGAPEIAATLDTSGQALAKVAGVTVATSDVRQAIDDTLLAVERNDASVYTADVNIGDERADGSVDGSGFFVVKVPPDQLEPLITDLGSTVGTISGRTQDTSDVTAQLVDLDIRIGVERDVIERFQVLLTQATEFQDIVEIERVISERTIALEQLLASQRTLEGRVELSTLTVTLQYVAPAPEGAATATNSITDAWRTGWDVFIGIVFAIGLVLAVAAPFLATGALVLTTIWFLGRRRSRRVAPTIPSTGASTGASGTAGVTEREDQLEAPTPPR